MYKQYFSLILWLWLSFIWLACSQEPELLPLAWLKNIRFVSIEPTPSTRSKYLIANGLNRIDFTIKFLDADKQTLNYSDSRLRILVNDEYELEPPSYSFSTKTPGVYTFTIKNLASKKLLSKVSITAVPEDKFPQVQMPVVFHYITDSLQMLDDTEKAQIQGALMEHLQLVNQAFLNQLLSPDPNAISANITFYPAETDLEGQPMDTPGVNFIECSEANKVLTSDELLMLVADKSYWDPTKYINIWMAKVDHQWSWATLPGELNPQQLYGIFLNSQELDQPMTNVLAHEFGHLFALYHVFEGGCQTSNDECDDTNFYPRDQDYFPNFLRRNCAGQIFQSTNIMDYGPGEMNTFTRQQVLRMRKTVDQFPLLPLAKNQSGGRIRQELPVDLKHTTIMY